MNLLEFASHYDHLLKKSTVNGEQVERLKPRTHPAVAVRIYQKYSSNPLHDTWHVLQISIVAIHAMDDQF
jgi:hypothetical protein